ncbi:MAG: multiprotein-bridging factor 1 family protein [Rickettsiales bacterium]
MTTPPIYPEQIKAARALINWKQHDLAQQLSLTAASVANLESGKTSISIEQMHSIINIFAKQNIEFIEDGVKKSSQQIGTLSAYEGLKLMLDNIYEYCSSDANHAVYLLNYNHVLMHKKLGDYKMFHVKRMLKLHKTNISSLVAEPSSLACSFIAYRTHKLFLPAGIMLAIVEDQIYMTDLLGKNCFHIKCQQMAGFFKLVYASLWTNGHEVVPPEIYIHEI